MFESLSELSRESQIRAVPGLNKTNTYVMWAIIVATALNFAIFFASYHFARALRNGTEKTLATDEMLASLSTETTVLGVAVAVVTLVTALGAAYGYTELRAATMRKTEEHIIALIQTMRKQKALDDATAFVLMEKVIPDRVFVFGRGPTAVPVSTAASELVPVASNNGIGEERRFQSNFPEGNNERKWFGRAYNFGASI